jgi:carbonic anhydrase/acetyltransferase-like protein (isoleucine patch superfamily)
MQISIDIVWKSLCHNSMVTKQGRRCFFRISVARDRIGALTARKARMPIYALGPHRPVIDPTAYVTDTAVLIGKVELQAQSSIWFGATLRGDNEPIVIGRGSNVQEGAVLHTDPGSPLTVDDHVTVGHQAMLHGCTIGAGSLIGIQAVVLNDAIIGKNCLVGACALVTTGTIIPDGSLVLGSPAKAVRLLTDDEIAKMHRGIQTYIERAARFQKELKAIDAND